MEGTFGGALRNSGDCKLNSGDCKLEKNSSEFVKESDQAKLCQRDSSDDSRNTTCAQSGKDVTGIRALTVRQVRQLTHREMVDAVEMGTLSPEMFQKEKDRRTLAREQRKTLKQKQEFVLKSKGKSSNFVVEVPVVESSQEMFDLPLSLDAFDAMTTYFSHDKPYWLKKMKFYKKAMPEREFLFKLNSCVNSLYPRGTVEYFCDLVWGSRRMRDKFMSIMESELDVASVQCAEPELEPIVRNEDLFIAFEEDEIFGSDSEWELESDSDDDDDDFFGFEYLTETEMLPDEVGFLGWDFTAYDTEDPDSHESLREYVDDYEYELENELYQKYEPEALEEYFTYYDYAVVQSDEPALEEVANIAGHGNLTFVEERPTDSDSSFLSQNISVADELNTMAEDEWITAKALLEREIIVYRGVWTEKDYGEMVAIPLPKCFVERNTFVRRQMAVAAFMRAGIEMRIQFNGNRFAAGSMIAAILPPMFEEDVDNYTALQGFNFPHVRIDAAVSNNGTLFVPFTHILTHFPQIKGSLESDSIVTLGRLVIFCINKLRVGQGASNVLNFTIYGRFVNPELHQTTWPIENFSYSDGVITQAGGEGEGFFKRIIGGGLTTALGGFLNKMTGGLAVGIGEALKGLIFDYPHDPSPPVNIVNNAIGPVCYGTGVDHSQRLALTPISQQEMTPGMLGSTDGDFNLKTLLQIPSLLAIEPWDSSMIPGTEIFSMPVTPVYMPSARIRTKEHTAIYYPTMQAYVCRSFCYWNGGLVLKIQIVKTEYNNGRLLFVYSPHEGMAGSPSTSVYDALEVYNQSNAVVVDIEEQKEIVVKLPFMSPRPWLRCDAFRTPNDFVPGKESDPNYAPSYLAESFCGFFRIFVLNRLVAPSNVPQSVDVNVFISCDDDFELAYPTTLSPLNVQSFGQGAFGGYQEYPFLLGEKPPVVFETNFENQKWIISLYRDGERLFAAGRIETPENKHWYESIPVSYLGTTDDETNTWCYKVSLMAKYALASGETGPQIRYMQSLDGYSHAVVQAKEEYTTNRVKEPMAIVMTNGQRMCEIAPKTVSENAMNHQTILRRFYNIYNSVPMYDLTGYTVVTIPVNPSFVPILRAPVRTQTTSGYGEPLPVDQIAWFTKLRTYWSGSLRYKILFDADSTDVEVAHVPTECKEWEIRSGIKEIDIQRIMAYGSAVAVSQVQGSLEVEVPFASPYQQLFVDVHNKYFDLRCQNGTLFLFFRRKMRSGVINNQPLTFSIFRSTGEDFRLNLLKAPPIVEEPQMTFGKCDSTPSALTLEYPEASRNLGNRSDKIPLPGNTGFKKVDGLGYFGYCYSLPESAEEEAKVQMFESVSNAITDVKKTHAVIQDTAIELNGILKDGNLTETLQSLNSISRKIDGFVTKTESTANQFQVSNETVKKYALIASEVVLCGTFVHQLKEVLNDPTLPNFITLGIEFGLIVGLTVSETLQSLLMRVVDWAMNIQVLQPEQARAQALDGATDFIDEHSGVICTVVAVLGTVLYGYMFGVLPSMQKIKEVIKSFFAEEESQAEVQNLEKALGFSLKNAHFSLLGLGALEKVYNKIIEWVQRFLYWMLDKENPEVVLARTAVEVKDRVLDLIRELDDLDYEPRFVAALEDPLVHNRFYRLQDEVYELTALCTDSKVDQRVAILLAECRKRTVDLIKRLEAEGCSATVRYDPFVVCLHGETGTGKTRFSEKVFEIYREVMGLPKHHLVYSKNIRDDYWSGYTRQPIVFWDEFGQSKEADKVSVPEFMTLRGDKPVKVNMASLADKGRDFTSQGIVMTTNVPYQDYDSVRDQSAQKRRRHIMIGMQHKRGFDANVLTDANHDAFPNWEHCDFALTARDEPRVIRAAMSMQDVLDYIREKMTIYHANQIAKLANTQVPNLPRGVIINPDLNEEDMDLELVEEAHLEEDIADEDDDFSDASSQMTGDSTRIGNLVENLLAQEPEEIAATQGNELIDEDLEDAWYICDPEMLLSDAEKFAADMFLATCNTMRKNMRIRTYLRAKANVKRKTSRLLQLAKQTFDGLIAKVRDFWNNNPKLCKILGVLTLLSGVGAIMHFRSKADTEHYDSGPGRTVMRRVIAEKYENGPARTAKARVIPEGSEDIQANEIAKKVAQYVYPIAWREGSTRRANLNCLHIGGHIILVPYHFFNHAEEGEWFEVEHRVHPVIVEFKHDRMYRSGDKDWVLYNCGVRLEAGKRLDKFFVDENNLGKVRQAKCMLITRDRDTGDIVRDCGNVEPRQQFAYADDNWGDKYIQKGWSHNLNTTVGQCGGPLIICNNALPSPGKIGGVHVAGFKNKSIGYVVLVTRQMIEVGLQTFGALPGEAPVPQCVEIGLHKNLRLVPEGDFTIVGMMPNSMAPAQPLKSSLVETPFQEQAIALLGPVPKIPAKLRPFEVDGTYVSPLKKAIVKYGHLTLPYPARNIRKVENYFVHMFDQRLKCHMGRRVYTIPEAVNGLPGIDFAEKMNMKSSPGWPYQMENRKPGKWHLFDAMGNIVDESVSTRLEERRSAAKELRRVESIWRDCMKDELRPVPKVMAGKTRLFTIAPVDFTILVRQMFLDFVMAFYSAYGDDFFSAVGINPESVDWTDLHDYLSEFNTQVVAGDYECFDGKEMPEIMMSVCNIINAWYGDSTENQNIRTTMFMEMIHTMQLCENLVYMTHQGNPSGNPLTTVINTIVNVYLLVLTWLEIFPEKTVDDFFQNVRVKAYGDDNLIAPKSKVIMKFNQNTIAQALLRHNIVYTAETKSGEEVPNSRPLSEVSFLKRGFRRDPEFGNMFWLPTMSEETLKSYFYYYHSAPDPQEQIQENQRSALLFAGFHGKEFYENYLTTWKQLMKTSGLESLQISFDEQVDAFHWGAGMREGKPQHVFKTDVLVESMEGFMKVTNSKPVRSVLGAIEAPFYYFAACLGIGIDERTSTAEDDRWAIAIPSGEGKSTLAREYPWLFVDHDELLLPAFTGVTNMPWKAETAREIDFPKEDRRVLLVHHPSFTKRRLVGSFITPLPTFVRINCLQRLKLSKPVKMSFSERNTLLVLLSSALEPELRRELTQYTPDHGLPSPAGHGFCAT